MLCQPKSPELPSAEATWFRARRALSLRLFLVGGSLAELVLLGTLGANGQTLRVAAADSFAWTLKAYSGVTVHQVAPERGAPSRTVNVRECDVSGGRRKMRLHAGW